MEAALAQHPPAMKVGGRRLSVSKPKHHTPTEQPSAPSPAGQTPAAADYPRPTGPGGEHDSSHVPPHNEEEVPKKEKKKHHHSTYDNERKMMETAFSKTAATRPTRDDLGNAKSFGGSGRIVQPQGIGFIRSGKT